MRKNHTHRGFYVNRDKKYNSSNSILEGRGGKNMGYAKVDEYRDLFWYLVFGEFQKYGWLVPIYRLRKNLKYRKHIIRRWKKEHTT